VSSIQKNLVKELNFIIDGEKRSGMLQDFKLLREKLGGKGASENAADIILDLKK